MIGPSRGSKLTEATRMLALLHEQADEVRVELTQLRLDLLQVQRELSGKRSSQIVEANEKLVLAALEAEALADTAAHKLSEMTHLNERDALTGIPNRVLLLDRLENAIAQAQRHGSRIAVLFVDLDNFKQINDGHGHVVGDKMLREAAHCLASVVRHSDTVSRYGGDEFLVLLTDVTQATDAALVAKKILRALAALTHVDDLGLQLTASIGIAIYPEDAEDAATLIDRADTAMYRCKRRQPGNFGYYTETAADETASRPGSGELQQRRTTRAESAVIEHDLHLRDLREANEQLVLAALSAQELEARADEAHRRQIAFLAMVAHELRSPLAPIRTAADLIRRAHPDEPLLEQLQVMIKRQVAHIARLVDDLLDGSRVRTGKFRLEPSTVDMVDTLKLAVETCRPAIDAKHQQLKLQLPEGPINVRGDAVRLAQVFSNLLSNSAKYTPEAGEIELSAKVSGNSLEVKVTDTGIGISADVLPHIFELFVRDVPAMAMHVDGLGIGLAVVRDLVTAHGGSVIATSAGRNLGTQMTVTLPLSDRTDSSSNA